MNRYSIIFWVCIVACALTLMCAAVPAALADPSETPPPVIPNPPPDKGFPLLDLAILLKQLEFLSGM